MVIMCNVKWTVICYGTVYMCYIIVIEKLNAVWFVLKFPNKKFNC